MAIRAAAGQIEVGAAVGGWTPYAVVGGLLLAQLAAILTISGGHLIYSLDDPYIHLAMAENIARGHYGINLSEPSAPSSSILWPFLLVPFAGTAFHDEWPLAINVLSALASVGVLRAIVRRALPVGAGQLRWLPPVLVLSLAIGLNLIGLAFTGMEHSLQVLLALSLALGLIIEVEERRVTWFLVAAVVLGPLVRYEALGPSAGAILFLGLSGRPGLALALGAAIALPLVAFSLFLHDLGLGWLPSSVLLKSQLSPENAAPWDMLMASAAAFMRTIPGHPSWLVLIVFFVLLVVAGRRAALDSAERRLASAAAVAVALHLLAGRYGWFGRYEIYILAVGATLLVYLWRDWLIVQLERLSRARAVTWICVIAAVAFGPSLGTLVLTPFAAGNIYEQQYQMHRLVTQFHAGPVAVNDLGWVSYRNDDHVLDLWGLGSVTAGTERLAGTPGWMDALADGSGVDLALIYEDWYPGQIPPKWQLLGRLWLGGLNVTAGSDRVAFFAVDPTAPRRLVQQLVRFAETLPPGVRFELTDEGKAALGD